MALFSFFNSPQNRSFDYKPRYWDPDKEALEEQLRQAEIRKEDTLEASKARISNSLRRKGGGQYNPGLRRKEVIKANTRLLMIIVLLCILAYILVNVYLPDIEKALYGI